ncbi:MAG: hypothetical protein GTO63_36715, partial [Anaerolineae bacterium]|nr:hypothetical protein [Anaerolineae bacterium]NIN99287.1 hypothetical protein [Anaerolineae bacterium]
MPQPAGTTEVLNITGLSPETQYWFALRTADEVPNWSPVSNSVGALTIDATPPAQVSDLEVVIVGNEYVILQWRSPGDDGNDGQASTYDVRYSAAGPLNETNFENGTSVDAGSPQPAGLTERLNVTGLSPETQYWFALRTADEVPNWSPVSLSVAAETTPSPPEVDDTPPVVSFISPSNGADVFGDVEVSVEATDDTEVREVVILVNGTVRVMLTAPPYIWIWPTGALSPGPYVLTAEATDPTGNRGSDQITVSVQAPGPSEPPTVLDAPRVEAIWFSPAESRLDVIFSKPMDPVSVEQSLSIVPVVPLEAIWEGDSHLRLRFPETLAADTIYYLVIASSA